MLTNTQNSQLYSGNNVTTEFDVPFPVFDTQHLQVFLVQDQTHTLQTLQKHYTFSPTQNGGTVQFHTPPTTQQNVLLFRDTPAVQTTSLTQSSTVKAKDYEKILDQITAALQDATLQNVSASLNNTPPDATPSLQLSLDKRQIHLTLNLPQYPVSLYSLVLNDKTLSLSVQSSKTPQTPQNLSLELPFTTRQDLQDALLPTPTPDDNLKVLTVIDATPSWQYPTPTSTSPSPESEPSVPTSSLTLTQLSTLLNSIPRSNQLQAGDEIIVRLGRTLYLKTIV